MTLDDILDICCRQEGCVGQGLCYASPYGGDAHDEGTKGSCLGYGSHIGCEVNTFILNNILIEQFILSRPLVHHGVCRLRLFVVVVEIYGLKNCNF